MSPYSRSPAPTSVITARWAPCRSSNCSPLGGTDGEAIDDVAKHARVGVDIREARTRALRRLVREASGAVGAVRDDIAVAVEDVVHDLEQEAELLAECAPRALCRLRQIGDPQCEPDCGGEEPSGLQRVQCRLVGRSAGDVEVLAADHAE